MFLYLRLMFHPHPRIAHDALFVNMKEESGGGEKRNNKRKRPI
jgi:hypothetical protein